MFVDNVEITIKAGNGGSGLASFRREKFLPFGGPDGGDGGKGGDIYFLADGNMEDLSTFKHKTVFTAENGGRGGPNQMHGLNANSLIIKVPVGTAVYVKKEGKESLVTDLQKDKQKILAAKGGKGGKGNVHFATATRKAPKIFQPGETGPDYSLILRVILPMDVCILGSPNSGKSTLLTALSGARPKVAEYPFTTREPVLGVVDDGVKKYVWAELPAIVDGSHDGKAAGNKYLGQAARAEVLVYLLDAFSADVAAALRLLREEVELFARGLAGKKSVIAVNKIDLLKDAKLVDAIKDELNWAGLPILCISAMEKQGLVELVSVVHGLVGEEKQKVIGDAQPEVIFRPKPVDQEH
jgi:GTP-binding protein